MKALITGSEGFVGRYLRAELLSAGYEVTVIDLAAGEGTLAADLLDPGAAESAVSQAAPIAVHCGALQSPLVTFWETTDPGAIRKWGHTFTPGRSSA